MQTGLFPSLRPALRFARSWRSAPPSIDASEVSIPIGDRLIPGTVVRGKGSTGRGWVVLHGMTRLGRSHPELRRFVGALASTGACVLVPEIREWIELEFAPIQAQLVLAGAVDWLHRSPNVTPGGVMLVGFSFGAPQALLTATKPELSGKIRGVVGWGGYADIGRTFRFSFTGEHEWEGVSYRQRPDPYARWVIGANCLSLTGPPEGHAALASALHQLAVAAGERRIHTWDPSSDLLKDELRGRLPAGDRPLFDLFAPPAREDPERDPAVTLVEELVPAIRRGIPLIEPVNLIDRLPVPIRLLHGRSDHLIPFSETMRLGRALEPRSPNLSTRLTGLFSHAGEDRRGSLWTRGRENIRFLSALQGIFGVAQR